MTSKTQLHKNFKIAIYTLIVCVTLLVCAGCKKDTAAKDSQAEFAIDKDYQRGPLTIHVRLDKTKATIAETFRLEFEAIIEPGFEVQMPKLEEDLGDFGILDWDNPGQELDENNNIISRNHYRLEPFLPGSFSLPAFTFGFGDVNNPQGKKYELTTEPIDIEVTSLLGDQQSELVIADIEDVVEIPRKNSYWLLFALCSVAGLIAAVGFWIYSRKKRVAELVRIFRPAHEIAYESLRKLVKEDLIKKGEIKEFYERISNILRRYIEHRFKLRAPERTTEEFLSELAASDVLSPTDKTDLAEFLQLSDLVKFAKHNPTTEQIQKTFDLAENFIEKTKSDENKIDVTEESVSGAV